MDVLQKLWSERALAIVRAPSRDQAEIAMEAAVEAGFRVCEFTLNTPGALDLVRAFARVSDLCVGVGTALTVEDVEQGVAAGARFVVSPVVDPAVIARARGLGAVAVPGCATPTEMWLAHRSGAPLQKIFPGPPGAAGPEYVRTVRGPMPFLRLVPTSGVDLHNAAGLLEAGAFAVGFVRTLFDPRWLEARDRATISAQARRCLEVVRGVSRGPMPG
jgi:2-dehydro-3-deoxyphosphogluconate aldolase/(4S)-4-hydroxy-2-oxoglutarate aldolase